MKNRPLYSSLCCTLLLLVHLSGRADTTHIISSINQARAEFSKNPSLSIGLSRKALLEAMAENDKRFIAKAYNTLGSSFYFNNEYDSAEIYHLKALEIQQDINDAEGLGRSYTNIGSIYSDKGLNDEAIRYFMLGEKKFAESGYKIGQAKLNNSLGILFYNIKDYRGAVNYFKTGVKLARELKDQVLEYSLNINLANALGDMGNTREAIDIYKSAYTIAKINRNFSDLAIVCNNICQSYLTLNNIYLAKKYDTEALALIKEHHLSDFLKIVAYTNHAIILQNEGDYPSAIRFMDEAIAISQHSNDLVKRIELYKQLSQTLLKSKDYERSIEAMRKAGELSDSLYTKNLEEKLSELNAIHNVEKKEAEISILNSEKKNQEKINILLIAVIAISLVSLVVTIYNYLRKRKDNTLISSQKMEVELQNKIIEEKQREIIDSITYAKRLQDAILPPETYFKKHLPDSFVLYQPKDIVAGDFYWLETVSSEGQDLVLFAVADCTGHGVPGAMVSVICSNALNRSVIEFKLTNPGKILDKTRELVIATFEKSSTEVKDGMDISFCCLNLNTLELEWAGANNPLWLIQNNELKETKADKQPIGKYSVENTFTTHHIQLHKGDLIYLLTDGFADQFGGPEGKKYKYKPLKDKLLSIHTKPMSQQTQELQETFTTWKKNLQQVDDVCIIGVRI